jgi:hypothetical protein
MSDGSSDLRCPFFVISPQQKHSAAITDRQPEWAFPTDTAIGAAAKVDHLALQFLDWGSIAAYFHSFQRFSIHYVTGVTFSL